MGVISSSQPSPAPKKYAEQGSLDQEVLALLKCTLCYEYMRPPIMLCVNGHNICNTCKPKISMCPTCDGSLSNLRNKTAENLTNKLRYVCRYYQSGCRAELPLEILEKHESLCLYQHFKCPFMFGAVKCSWNGTIVDFRAHLRSLHPISVFEVNGSRKICRKVLFTSEYRWLEAVFTLDEVFISSSVAFEGVLYHRVVHVGSREKSKQFRYRVVMLTVDGDYAKSNCKQMCSYKDFMDRICDNNFEYLNEFFNDENHFSFNLKETDKYMNSDKCYLLYEDIVHE